ncbi:MAG: helicase [Planctomycetota bacterium]
MPAERWALEVGGLDAAGLQQALEHAGIALNPLAEELLSSAVFACTLPSQHLSLESCTVQALGFPDGATLPAILDAAQAQALHPCPMDAAAYLRLHHLQQVEDSDTKPRSTPGAPAGSLTVATVHPGQPDTFPRGFYLRNIDGTLWLRGYRADDLHVWHPEDTLVFRRLP